MADLIRWLAATSRRRQVTVGLGAAAIFALGFALGQIRAGHNSVAAEVARQRLARQVEALDSERRAATQEAARLETAARVDSEAYARVEEQLTGLQAKIMEQQEELAFYRGVIGGPAEGGLRIRDFAVDLSEGSAAQLRFVLAQARGTGQSVRGRVQIRVEGMRAGRLVSLDVANLLADSADGALSFDFRYFQEVVVKLRVPTDFSPRRVVIRVVPATRGIRESVESFPWSARSA